MITEDRLLLAHAAPVVGAGRIASRLASIVVTSQAPDQPAGGGTRPRVYRDSREWLATERRREIDEERKRDRTNRGVHT